MCINGKFDFYLTDIQATSYHHSVGSICKWTMLNFFPFVSPHSFVVRAINYRLLFCILYTFILWYKECNLERESHRHRVRGTFLLPPRPPYCFLFQNELQAQTKLCPACSTSPVSVYWSGTARCILVVNTTALFLCFLWSCSTNSKNVTAWTAQFYSKVHL